MSGLRRSKTMPASSRAPDAGRGKRAEAGHARRRSARTAASAARRTAPRSTASIKKIVKDLQETKFFNSAAKGAVTLTVDSTAAFGTFGLGTTSVKFTPGTSVADLSYGAAMANMEMLNPFSNNSSVSTEGWQRANALSGSKCIPLPGKVTLNFRRVPLETAGTGAEQKNLMRTVGPLRVRVIRVTAKGTASTLVQYDPKQDLFQTQHGQDCGVEAGSTQPLAVDLETIPVNRDKYTVLNDIKFTLARPAHYNYSTNSDTYRYSDGFTSGPSAKVITFYPQLAAKKGGSVQYLDPNDGATSNALDGQRREFILVHAWYPGIDTKSNMSAVLPLDLLCHVTPTSRFKDG